jgi:hypothetical protein
VTGPWWLPVEIGGRACGAGSRGPLHPATCPPIRAGRADATPDRPASRALRVPAGAPCGRPLTPAGPAWPSASGSPGWG